MCAARSRFGVASNPEFLREGCAVADSLYPDRIVVGAADQQTLEMMRELYSPLVEQIFDSAAGRAAARRAFQSTIGHAPHSPARR